MSKKTRGTQIEMLLPIPGKRDNDSTPAKKPVRSLSYSKVVESLRKKGLTRTVNKKSAN